MATLTKRNGKWQAKIRKKGQRTITKSFLLYEDAERWGRKTESELERGIYVEDTDEARNTTIKEAAHRFRIEHLGRLRHGKREKNRIAAILYTTKWGSISLSNLKSKDVTAYIRKRENAGRRPDTIRLDLTLISKMFKHARTEWGLESLKNPVDAVRRPSLRGTSRNRRLEEGEEEQLIQAAKPELKPVILFAIETAMRREEIATLTWPCIDLKKRTAHLPRTKNGETRTVPLSSQAIQILQEIPRNIGDEPVFGLSKDQITDRMRSTVKRAELVNLRFHDLRHEATSRFF